jgi:cytochrome c553
MVGARSVEANALGGGRGSRIVKATGLRLALLTAALTMVSSVSAGAQERMAPARGGLEAKLEYCKTCHGLSGQGYLGYFAMPRLAGQQPEYIEAQLRAFIERRRSNPIMRNVAHVLSPSMITALAMHFKNLNPKPFGGAPRDRSPLESEFTRKVFPKPMFPHALPVMAPRARARTKFRDWRARSTSIWSAS